ncbi:hypothetical protein [Pedobacter sp. SYSU D00535]|uniref:hypothetical protein n=1 Tax=Pedobacter sp. SYSU D00535 TaxID=2810308 RepID=UPI001A969C99|nr:hypothetical protein [Pedobacter sp. SYSU D00535]
MYNIKIENSGGTQIRIDGKLFHLQYRFHSAIEFDEVIVFHCYPMTADGEEIKTGFTLEGRNSLFGVDKITGACIWEMPDVEEVYPEPVSSKKVTDFVSKKHFEAYLQAFQGRSLISVYSSETRKLVDAISGQILGSMEVR